MEGMEVVEFIGEIIHVNVLRDLLRLAQLLDPDAEELVGWVREEEVVED